MTRLNSCFDVFVFVEAVDSLSGKFVATGSSETGLAVPGLDFVCTYKKIHLW